MNTQPTGAKESIIIGDYKDFVDHSPIFSYQCPAKHLNDVWQRCGLLSDFFAQSVVDLVKQNDSNIDNDSLKESCSYLLNELLENIANFALHQEYPCVFSFWQDNPNQLITEFHNFARIKDGDHLISVATQLANTDDLGDLYLKKIEENVTTGTSASGLGFLTLINDYSVQFAFKFDKMADNYGIKIQTSLNAKEI